MGSMRGKGNVMKIVIKKNELMDLSNFMWENFEKEGFPQRTSSMFGEEYGKAISTFSVASDGYYDTALYKATSGFYGDIYILVKNVEKFNEDKDDEEEVEYISILPSDICVIEVED